MFYDDTIHPKHVVHYVAVVDNEVVAVEAGVEILSNVSETTKGVMEIQLYSNIESNKNT